MATLAPCANGQTVRSSGKPAGSVSVDVLHPAHQRAGTVPLKIRDWPLGDLRLAVPVGDAPTRVAASGADSRTRMQRSRGTRAAQRVTAGVAMGILGALAGGLAGGGVALAVNREYGPLAVGIGGTIGASAGAALGVLMVR